MEYTWRDRVSDGLKRTMLALFLLLLAAALALGGGQDGAHLAALGIGAAGGLLCWTVLPAAGRQVRRLGAARIWLLLTAVCLGVKLFWVLRVQIPVEGDYKVFWDVAQHLAQQETIQNRYVSLFPHIFGYASCLSVFIRVLGPLPLLTQILNVLLTLWSGTALFLLGLRWRSLEVGAAAYLLWLLCPSQTIYNSLVLSEPLYTALLLSFCLVLSEGDAREPWRGRPLLWGGAAGCACGLLLRMVQIVRPIAAVLLIALLLWLFLLTPRRLFEGQARRFWLSVLAVTAAVYGATGPLWTGYMTHRLGEEPAGTPGYSILVGFNQSSGGRWNAGDSELLYAYSDRPGTTAEDAQRELLETAVTRIASDPGALPGLMRKKLGVFLGSDSACVEYCRLALPSHGESLSLACNGFYYAALLLAAAGGARLWRRGEQGLMLLMPLYVLGLTLAQMLVEVASRYHYSLVPCLLLLAAAGLPWAPPEKGK